MISSDHNTVRLAVKNKTEKSTNPWRINSMLLNSLWVTEEVKRVIKLIKIPGDKNLWDAAKAVLRQSCSDTSLPQETRKPLTI